ncbi:hypothetical protein CC1G_15271 [Coprinopsis cinerea okayama7|uniref:Uncharacterized protein n=1 Tax=Coprinopsis cinerea (strain Okayama-7 / 130 / ATCC MYA-4618 / FGSC 9003) TaxID=240176 RepID=D6RPX0_COPC7|nr:hypothetical protein CC1G_15271 [Coprinopsis cinerea okayama7\|eukprot:XP_002910363.1 hypothetical protein CC1G_15271 [Coprinopsis cinerea okayama7\
MRQFHCGKGGKHPFRPSMEISRLSTPPKSPPFASAGSVGYIPFVASYCTFSRACRFNVRRQWVFYSRHDVIARNLALRCVPSDSLPKGSVTEISSLHRHIILEFVSPSEPRRWALAFPNPTFKARDIFGRVHILFDGNLSHCFSRARPFSMDRKQSRGKDRNAVGERPSGIALLI